MGLTSLQVSMETPDWLQGMNHEENGIDSSSSPSGDTMTCSRPLEKKLRPQNDQALKCPRCDSTHTKFCYYNNYSLTQPRYFCKTCRRYWTKGGSLRNIPVGGGCRKNKRVSAKKSSENPLNHCHSSSSSQNPTDLHLSFPEVQLSHLTNLFGNSESLGNINFMERGYNAMLENSSRQVDHFMESKFDAILGNTRSHDFMGTNDMGLGGGLGDVGTGHGFTHNFHGLCSPYENNGCFIPFGGNEDTNAVERKPNKFLSLDWQDHGCSEVSKESLGFLDCIGSWNAMMNGYGSSATNPLM